MRQRFTYIYVETCPGNRLREPIKRELAHVIHEYENKCFINYLS
ncbi:uncharacterized protein EbC_41770 [Erwinia billingiae Eb661]|uniref:Uncharacterized protein n=1 Tax=Erwinia billingiae (strain Eb661) TaxID=634500 RepID=D8MY01_ERWBE|nr:uncharacterized protein EbC_41770 [Erwinia billingiae Eb661]